ncbi:MAG: hypothetical protein ACK4N1_15745 [Pseudorhizobium sp.]
MKTSAITLSVLGLICLTAAGCVSEGGSRVAYDSGPRYDRIDRSDRNDRRPDYDRRDQRDYGDRRGGDSRWDGRRGNDERRERASREDTNRDGRWIIRDGQRIWIPERR